MRMGHLVIYPPKPKAMPRVHPNYAAGWMMTAYRIQTLFVVRTEDCWALYWNGVQTWTWVARANSTDNARQNFAMLASALQRRPMERLVPRMTENVKATLVANTRTRNSDAVDQLCCWGPLKTGAQIYLTVTPAN